MSTAISTTQTTTILPKAVAILKTDDKPRLQRSSSIETIKRINTFICSPQTYLLPAILTMWLKSSQNGLQASAEKTIFLFRSLIFGSILYKFLFSVVKSGRAEGRNATIRIQTNLRNFLATYQSKFLTAITFGFVVIVLTVQAISCVVLIVQSIVPLGLGFLLVSVTYIMGLGHNINRFYCIKRDVKRKKLQ